ncbi:hypothetical protein SO802_029107 [Lithocarpus litseifolius]|uniref:Uncharacterized protein n=1 Tax=Lithocarpus litseifolius TaxID=425828 RepID=A0AAW2BT60_9ROSI
MAGAVAGVGVGFGLSCSTTKLSHRHSSSSSSSSSSSKTTRRCCVKMAVSLDEKKKNYTLQKSEEAFAAAKAQKHAWVCSAWPVLTLARRGLSSLRAVTMAMLIHSLSRQEVGLPP